MKAVNLKNNTHMRGVRRNGPCITGGVSPSLHHARQSVTGSIFTGRPLSPIANLQFGFAEPNFAIGDGAASSGSPQSQDLTKARWRPPLILHCSVAVGPATSDKEVR